MASSGFSTWSLHCRKCKCRIVGLCDLKLRLLGSAGVHVRLNEIADAEFEETIIEKVQNPKPKQRDRTPFKALCRGRPAGSREACRTSLGAYTNGAICFSATAVYFCTRWSQQSEQKWKKWSEAKETLQDMGMSVEIVSAVARDPALASHSTTAAKKQSLPLVYCDVTLTSDNTINRLTQDKPRDYQRQLFKNAMEGNSLVYLPTGCGKTLVAAMAVACMTHLNPRKVAVFLAPKTPLVHQQYAYLKRQLPGLRIQSLTGDSGSEPGDKTAWIQLVKSLENHSVDAVVLSPQIFLNFLEDEGTFLRMSHVSLVVFDEAHNCSGNHPYAKIMELFYAHVPDKCKPLILALSASPASGLETAKIEGQLTKLLGSLHCRAVVPRSGSGDLQTYWNRPKMTYLLKELNQLQKYLETNLEGYLRSLEPLLTRLLELSDLQSHVVQSCNYKGILRNAITDSQNKSERVRGLALAEHAMSVLSTIEANSVLGCDHACASLVNIFSSIETAANPMDRLRRNIVSNLPCYQNLVATVNRLHNTTHTARNEPSCFSQSDRFQVLVAELRKFAEKVRRGDESCRGIVFVKMRKTCAKLCEELNKDPLVGEYLKPKKFVGHGKGTYGMEWKEEQEPILREFHSGACKLLVSTSVLEEGLDVPACNLVVRFDSVMSMRALVQSRGRAARRSDSRFIIICNDAKEMATFKELETKERNIESAVDSMATVGIWMVQGASERGCEVRKLDIKHQKMSDNNPTSESKKRGRRYKAPSRVSVTVHVEIKNEMVSQEPAMQSLRPGNRTSAPTQTRGSSSRVQSHESQTSVLTQAHGNTLRARSLQSQMSALTLARGNPSRAQSLQNQTSAPTQARGNTLRAESLQGQTSAFTQARGNTLRAQSLQGQTSVLTQARGNTLRAESLQGQTSAFTQARGNTLTAQSLQGQTSVPTQARGNTLRVQSLQSQTTQARSAKPLSTVESLALKAIELFEKRFKVISHSTEISPASQSPGNTSGQAHFRLEAQREQSRRSTDDLFHDVLRVWCEDGHAGSWLERSDRWFQTRKMVFHILPIEILAGGDFKNRGTFSELWEHDCRHRAEIIFLHDLKIVTIVFFNSSEVLHKIEFRYDQLREFILLDVPHSAEESANMFLCLRHVPQLSAGEPLVILDDETEECSFSEYYLRGDESDDELPENVQVEDQASAQPDESSDENSEEDITDSVYFEPPVHDHVHPEPDEFDVESNAEVDPEGTSTSDDESLSFFGEEMRAVDEMVRVKVWHRRCAIDDNISPFGAFLALRIQIPYSLDLIDALEVMKSFGKKIYYAPVKIESQPSELNRITPFTHEARYAHDCLTGLHPNVRPRLSPSFYELLRVLADRRPSDWVNAIYQISSILEHDYFADPESELRGLMTSNRMQHACISRSSVPGNCTLVKRLVLSPTRLIPFPPEVMEQNRVVRHFDSDNFLCVNIREEDYSKLRGHKAKLDEVLKRIKAYMDHGLWVGGLLYQFVGCSNSQMRSHGCWFVHPTIMDDADSIRKWMGDFSNIRCVASYMSRLGQCFSTSLDAIGITLEEGVRWTQIQDVKWNGYCFSDGIGTISPQLARKVCIQIGKPGCRSALQIRFAGCKGVLCQDPELPENRVCIRPSMRKFESDHRRLEVLQTSRPQAVYLNQQTIMLLSNLGVPDEVFLDLQQKMLDGLAAMMLNEDEALQRMSNIIRTGINYKSLAENGVSLTTEPYFKSLLCSLYKERIYRLLKKSRILLPVSESRLMMGVMDETGILEYGQVFVQCTYMTSEGDGDDERPAEGQRFIVEHRVVVTRNPCLHPGDVRELVAVDVPELRHLVDCVVFPRKGPRPHPNEMAGGDLDGDLYFVSWSDDFKPRKDLYEPMKYPVLVKKEKDGPITVDDMTTFYAEYIQYEALGVIDNTHKVWADLEENGVESGKCITLAEAHSLAVDAPKTGMWITLPVGCNVQQNPDFMMNPTKPSYVSQKLLGRLFRECRDFEETMNHMLPVSGVQLDARLLHPGYEAYLESAATTYGEYASQVKTLMTLYGITSEGEVMSGCFHKLKGDFGRERSQIAFVVRKMLQQVRTNVRCLFFREFEKEGERLSPRQVTASMKRKASAWYHHAYKPIREPTSASERDGVASAKFVSFPWVVDDVLVTVLRGGEQPSSVPAPLNVTSNIARSVHEIFTNDASALVSGYQARIELRDVVAGALNTQDSRIRLVMFGSSASLLLRPHSDLDLCVLTSSAMRTRVELLQSLEPVLRRAFGRVELIENARVPVIRLGKLKNPRRSSTGLKLSCDISADPNGFMKTRVLLSYFNYYPWLLPLLRVIILWAHNAGLTKKIEGVRINTNVLVFMLLSFCVQAGYILPFPRSSIDEICRDLRTCQNADVEFWKRLIKLIDGNDGEGPDERLGTIDMSNVGGVLLEFYEKRQEILYGSIQESFRLLLGATTFTELLNPEDIQILREQMQKAYHVLAIHGSGHTLLDVSASEIQRTFTLSGVQSLVIAGSERSHSRDLSRKSGAEVTIRPQLPGSGRGLILEARGTIGSIRALEVILSAQKNEYAKNKLSVMSKCFVRGASMITFEGCRSDDDNVTLVPYWGEHHQTHDQRIRHVPLLESHAQSPTTWEESHAFQSFRNKFLNQIKVVIRDYDSTIHGELEFVVHFGRIYAFDIPNALSEDSEPITINDLQYSSDKGRSTRAQGILPARMRFRKPGASGRAKVKAVRRHKTKEKKRDVDKSANHSLFTVVDSECRRDIQDYLERKGYEEQLENGKETYTATVRLGTKDFYVCYDNDFVPTTLKLPRLRWFMADIKRPWKARVMSPGTENLDGSECDVRLMLGTSREFTREEVCAGDYEKYMSILEEKTTASVPYPFKIQEELRKKLQLVRHKETAVFHQTASGTTVYLSKVTEYSRLKSTGIFKKVFHRCEMVVKPALPHSWENANEVERFLQRAWKLSFRLAKKAST